MASSNVVPLDLGQNYRKDAAPIAPQGADIIVHTSDPSAVNFDMETNTTQIALPDGDVVISLGPPTAPKKSADFDSNLAELLTESELSTISEKLLLGIDSDSQSRAAWLENMSNGISLLGLEVKQPRGASVAGSTPSEGISTVDHPLLLEAVLRFQANARGELLPTDGPVKVRNDGEGNALAAKLADALEKDLNHYLTKVAKEYYPDTDRMLLMLGFSGISFKKGYHDPIKRRPVIASIDAKDLIVSNAATDIDGAGRVTHRIMMRPSILRRMQLVGAYRDIALPENGLPASMNPIDSKINQIQGIAPPSYAEAADQDRELYECYCEIEVPGFEHEMDGKDTGLPLPYKVTIDKEARRILEIRRNWEEDDPFCMARNRIIAYIFIPGLGFYGIGLLNILGNATKAVTAAWRLMIDAGMFSNFPGFLYIKSLAKQLTNQFRVPPGGGMPIDTVGQDIRSAIMPLPYKDPSAVFIQLIENIAQTAQRVGGTAELQIGEGKQDAPVGTTLAMIEQATKLISAVHKRLHQAQGQEFDLLKSMLMEDPSALWRHNKKSKVLKMLIAEAGLNSVVQAEEDAEERHRQLFLTALADCELSPAADPNTSSQTERYLKVVAMRQMAMSNPGMDINAVDQRALSVMGIDDADSLFKPPQPIGAAPPNPQDMSAQANLITAQTRVTDSQNKARETSAKIALDQADLQNKSREIDAREKIAALDVARTMVVHKDDKDLAERGLAADNFHQNADRQVNSAHQNADRQTDSFHQNADRKIQAQGIAADNFHQNADRLHDTVHQNTDRQHAVMQQGVEGNNSLRQQLIDKAHGIALANLNNSANASQAQGVAQQSAMDQVRQQAHDLALDANQRDHELMMQQQDHAHQAEQGELQRKHQAKMPRVSPNKAPSKSKKK